MRRHCSTIVGNMNSTRMAHRMSRPVPGSHRRSLKDCGFNDEETGVIVTAISRHRDPEAAKEKNLNGILYRADKASRACFACDAEKDCNWKDGKKNLDN